MGRGPKAAKGRAKRAGSRKSRTHGDARVRDLEQRLAEALRDKAEAQEQQAATAEILRVISSSPTDVQPVFDAIVANAAQLCGAEFSAMMRFEGGLLHLVAVNNLSPAETAAYHTVYPRSPGRDFVVGRAFVEARPVHVEDIEADPDYDPRVREIIGRAARYRTILGVPILRDGVPIGVFGCGRHKMKPFTAAQIALLQTFADQAVIAIENVRLFTQLQEKNQALTQAHAQMSESLEQQTATSEILKVISGSPTDVQPVFDTIARSAKQLCDSQFCAVFRFDGQHLHFVAHDGLTTEAVNANRRAYPAPADRGSAAGRAMLTGTIEQIPDVTSDPEYTFGAIARISTFRSIVAVPMLRDGVPIGAITVRRAQTGLFPGRQIDLLRTFADQAVIAIENVRLFKELQASNSELKTALDKQTATSDILRVISRSQTDVQPVFDTIITSAGRLLRGHTGALTRLAGDQIELVAHTSVDDASDASLRAFFPQSLHSERPHAAAVRQRAPINIADTQSDPEIPEPLRAIARARGYHGWVIVPMLRQDEAIGTIAVTRGEAGGFTDDEIALLQTFAAQAVIAIENVRLFTELQTRTHQLTRSVEQLTALAARGESR